MKVIDVQQRSAEWHAWRKGGVSATSCAVIMDQNPDKTKLQLWRELVGLDTPPDLACIPQVRRGVKFAQSFKEAAAPEPGKGADIYSVSFWTREKVAEAAGVDLETSEAALFYCLEAVKVGREKKYYFQLDSKVNR